MAVLLSLDPWAEGGTKLEVAKGGAGSPLENEFFTLGTDTGISLALLREHYDAVGSMLHCPTLAQREGKRPPNASRFKRRLGEVVTYLDAVLGSPIFDLNTVTLHAHRQCERCSYRIREPDMGDDGRAEAKCPECRLSNLASIRLGKHLKRTGEAWHLEFDEEEVKNNELIPATWPLELKSPLERYLAVHRMVLLRPGPKDRPEPDALWISQRGGPMGVDAVQFQIKERTMEEFGVALNPHSFRTNTATAVARFNPDYITDVMSILGHRDPKTSELHYNKARMMDAGQHYHSELSTRRRAIRTAARGHK
jgi:integrase